jgi:hypothetical protein
MRNPRRIGQLGRGESAAIEKRREHGRLRRLSDQLSDLGYQWPSNHRRNAAPGTAGPQVGGSRLDADASIAGEAFIRASDRFRR